MRVLVSAALLLALTSCLAIVTPEELLERDRQTCAGIGFTSGSDQFANCVLQLQVARVQGHHAHR